MVQTLGRPSTKVQSLYLERPPLKGLHLHMSGVLIEVGGYPIDLGLPGRLDQAAIEKAGLLG